METPQNRMESHRKTRILQTTQNYATVQCPNCSSHRVRTVKTWKPTKQTRMRTHRCQNCPAQFNSVETIPTVDREDLPNGLPVAKPPEVPGRKPHNPPPPDVPTVPVDSK